MRVAFSILVLATLVQYLFGAQCTPDPNNPCVTTCNGTTFDISKLFDYPYNISGIFDYYYIWNPCRGYTCRSPTDNNAAICQKADQYYNCGHYQQPIFILERYDPYMFRIEYTSGVEWRISIFRFIINEAHPEPKVTFISEQPGLQYNFEVIGKCLGQPGCHSSGPNPFH